MADDDVGTSCSSSSSCPAQSPTPCVPLNHKHGKLSNCWGPDVGEALQPGGHISHCSPKYPPHRTSRTAKTCPSLRCAEMRGCCCVSVDARGRSAHFSHFSWPCPFSWAGQASYTATPSACSYEFLFCFAKILYYSIKAFPATLLDLD